ncbi:hypothetical protein IW261DRAFT_1608196 [Armillaria novae-zelandiae]|uniref:Uncharacterized protein n=1 Tax=Armillaria novae-zelandiae TaxID=153914 RepID=A0AA39TBT7_9AGAR|nr:hypothetical protein IW261DRAFT_1608196 [Armillaria novae-zelandiae]
MDVGYADNKASSRLRSESLAVWIVGQSASRPAPPRAFPRLEPPPLHRLICRTLSSLRQNEYPSIRLETLGEGAIMNDGGSMESHSPDSSVRICWMSSTGREAQVGVFVFVDSVAGVLRIVYSLKDPGGLNLHRLEEPHDKRAALHSVQISHNIRREARPVPFVYGKPPLWYLLPSKRLPWIGVKPKSLTGQVANTAAFACLDVLAECRITDVDVEIRELSVARSAGPKLLPPALSKLLLVTARHVVFPPNERKNESQLRFNVLLLGGSGRDRCGGESDGGILHS